MEDTYYIVQSGAGYLFDSATGMMVGNRSDPIDAALKAERMSQEKAERLCEEMKAEGKEAWIVRLRIGRL